jgi:hypothetical protein
MEREQYNLVKTKIEEMTPSLVEGAVEVFETDPELVARFGSNIREVAQQGIVTLINVLLGSLQLDYPQLLEGEIKWVEHLLQSRQINPQTMYNNLARFRTNLSIGLPTEYSAEVLKLYDEAIGKVKGL